MANLKDLLVNGVARVIGKVYAPEFVGKLVGNADTATTATKLGTSTVGGTTTPIYLNAGAPTAISYTIETSVPKNALFTDHIYSLVGSKDSTGLIKNGSSVTSASGYTACPIVSGIPYYKDTTSVSANTTGSGNAVTAITASGSAISVTKGATFLTSHQDISGKENISNKVKSWSATTTDTNYPSEKLVKDTLDNKAPLSHNHSTSNITSGTLAVARGGTGLSSFTKGDILYASADNTLSKLAKGTDGQVLKLSNGVPVWGTDNNSWRGIADNLTTDNGEVSLSAKQGKVLNEKFASFEYRGKANTWSAVNTFSASSDVTSASSTASGAIIASNGGIWAAGGIRGNKVYNAVWNDLADCIPVDDECELTPGYCYCFDGEKYYKSSKYLDDGIIGIHSDTYGMHMGYKDNCKQMDVAVAGFVLAYVDKEYPVGTPLTCTENGYLTKIEKSDKMEYPEKIVATYWKNEPSEYWGGEKDKIKVNGRKWVKIK